ncbi:hypothetical protein SEA_BRUTONGASTER_139 [Gordonia phage BrutonGaster]|uniref:Uncharacterized protein n=1 Tax=Gordonia phage BrutonGaster TaxID=2530116 RepID=A0A482JKP0_9CAUD|nr:hypothetical protein HOV26_gp043 [Gordonia phage BrutonGaster]QBP33353.1 hypothetical protein SEA_BRUTONGASTER_139 [Gordonia phage BrutonGaster]
MTGFPVGQRVQDTYGPKTYRGTVIEKRGTMFNDTTVLVLWDDDMGSCWENPAKLTAIEEDR